MPDAKDYTQGDFIYYSVTTGKQIHAIMRPAGSYLLECSDEKTGQGASRFFIMLLFSLSWAGDTAVFNFRKFIEVHTREYAPFCTYAILQ